MTGIKNIEKRKQIVVPLARQSSYSCFKEFIFPPLVAKLTWSHLEMHKDGILVSEYWKEMTPKAKLHQFLLEAKERIERNIGIEY